MLTWLVFFLGCSDPEFGHFGDALEAYDQGRAALSTGSPMVAAEAFARAGASDPGSHTLIAWEARALRQANEDGMALNRLNAGLQRFPDASVLRYDRAALRAKMGDIAGASEDLRWLYANERADPIAVGEDPDFVSLRTDSAARMLVPSAQVEASVELASPTVLVGESFVLDFRITSRAGAPVTIKSSDEASGPLRVVRIVEDLIDSGDIWAQRRLSVDVQAVEGGKTVMGPWVVQSAATSVLTERIIIEAVEIDGRRPAPETESYLPLVVPSALWADRSLPMVTDHDGEEWAVLGPGHSVRPSDSKSGLRMEYREGGQPKWTAWRIDSGRSVELWNGGEQVSARD